MFSGQMWVGSNSVSWFSHSTQLIKSIKGALCIIWCGVNRLGDSGVIVNTVGQLLLTRRGKTRMDGVRILFEFYTAPL